MILKRQSEKCIHQI